MFAASALTNTNAALQASFAGGLGANLASSSLLNSSLTNELASNLNNFGGGVGGVGGLSNLQASLTGGQSNNSFASRGLSKMDNDVGFGGNNAFGGSNFGGGRDFDGGFNRGDNDRVPGAGGGFSGNQSQGGGGNRQNTNGSRPMSDTILIGNVCSVLQSDIKINLDINLFISVCDHRSYHQIPHGKCCETNSKTSERSSLLKCGALTWEWYDLHLNGTLNVLCVSFNKKIHCILYNIDLHI